MGGWGVGIIMGIHQLLEQHVELTFLFSTFSVHRPIWSGDKRSWMWTVNIETPVRSGPLYIMILPKMNNTIYTDLY